MTRWLSVAEAADRLDITRQRVRVLALELNELRWRLKPGSERRLIEILLEDVRARMRAPPKRSWHNAERDEDGRVIFES